MAEMAAAGQPSSPSSFELTSEKSLEWSALRACVNACVGGDGASLAALAGRCDWDGLLELAERHAVVPLLAAAVRRLPDELVTPAIRADLAERTRAQALVTLRMSAELLRIAQTFAAGGMGMLAVKGPALALQAYGDAAMRSYGDLDLLVRDGDVAHATQLMLDAGYEAEIPLHAIAAGKIPGQYTFRRRDAGLLVELHNDRTMRYYPRTLPIEAWFARATQVRLEGREIPAPALEDHLILVCVHGAKHFWERLLWIADVAALVARGQAALRWELVAHSAKDAGAETMLHGGLLLAAQVLQARLPAEILAQAQADGAARAMTEQVVRWLPEAGEPAPGLLGRALFRACMRGGGASGAGYCLRLLFSPTEEDWDAGSAPRSFLDVVKRPFRLAKKHGAGGKR
jgi:hypothetical protein